MRDAAAFRMRSAMKAATAGQAGDHWSAGEIDEAAFADIRLGRRLGEILRCVGDHMGESVPHACDDWASTKAAYRFLSNERVSECEILAGHFGATARRFSASSGPVLLIQDTTEFIFKREQPGTIGFTKNVNSGRDKKGRVRHHTLCGVLMHSCLAVTADGLALGLPAVKFWTRRTFKGTAQLKRHINPTRVPIEQKESVRWLETLKQSMTLLGDPARCVHIADRESDIYELYCLTQELGTHFVVRSCVDRLAGDGGHTIAAEMEDAGVRGLHRIEIRDAKGKAENVTLEISFRRIHVLPPIGKQKHYPALDLTVIHATERGAPKGRKPIEWKLITDFKVSSRAEAIEKINWYAMRWKIEVFHKILKSGCRAEESKLRSAARLANLISLYCIISWRVLWLTMLNRTDPDAKPDRVLTAVEMRLLDSLVKNSGNQNKRPGTISFYLTKLARLGGYLARNKDPPPGNQVIWKGLTRLNDITLGAETIMGENCG
jgi:hypothetical protein